MNESFWVLPGCWTHWSRIVYHRYCSFLRCSSFYHLAIMEKVPNQPNSHPKTSSRSSKGYDPCRRLLYFCYSQAELRMASTCLTSMVVVAIGNTISATTAHRRLNMNSLYTQVPQVCIPLSVLFRVAWLKWCRQHENWTESNCGNVMFTDESRFAQKSYNRHVRVYKKQHTHNHWISCLLRWNHHGLDKDFIGISHQPAHLQGSFCDGCMILEWPHCEIVQWSFFCFNG